MSNFYKSNYLIGKKFRVSSTTVQNWIDKSLKGEINLELGDEEGRWKVINNLHNQRLLFELSRKAEKFDRMKEKRVEYTVDNKLYEILSPKQVKLLARSLQDDLEIPLKYVYIGEEGVKRWYTFHEASTKSTYSTYLEGHDFFLEVHLDYILGKFNDRERGIPKINLIDLGCGTADYTITCAKKMDKLGLLNSVIALDISQVMLDRLSNRFKQKDLKHIPFYSKQCDMDEGLPFDFLFDLSSSEDGRIPALYLNFGGQITNNEVYEQVNMLYNIATVMNKEDRLLVVNSYHEKEMEITYPSAEMDEFFDLHRWILDLLGIKQEDYTIHFDYSEQEFKRTAGLKLVKDITLNFDKINTLVKLKAGQELIVWKHRRENHQTVNQNAAATGMRVDLSSTDTDDSLICYMLKKR